MKRIIKIVVILLLMIPIIIYGDTFERAKSRANKYLNGGAYADSYGKYLVSDINYSGNIPFDFKENGKLEVASGFVRAGFLSRYEYERTVISSDGNSNHQSYLFKGSKYWSITSSGSNKHYVIASGDEEDSKNNHVRVTEFVLPETEVTGKGSIEDPWVFVPKYKVSLYSNDTTMGVIDPNPNPDANTNNKYYRAGSSASIIIVSQPGYKYKSNECNATYSKQNGVEKLTISNITKDLKCKVIFGLNLYTITLGEESDNILPREMYLKYEEGYYKTEEATEMMNELESLPSENTGYDFDGLETPTTNVIIVDKNGKVKQETNNQMNEDTKLRVRWKPIVYTIDFEENDGTPEPTPILVTFGNNYGSLPTVSKTGYTFTGWYTENTGGTKVESTTILQTASDHTLYAQYRANTYTVSFNANGGTPTPSSKNITYGSTYGELPTVSKTGYTFNGWYTAASGGTQVTASTKMLTPNAHTLYAHFTAKTFTVTFNANGGGTPSPTSKTVTYAETYGTLATISRDGYLFNGWYTAASGGNQITSNSSVQITANQTLYAQWSVDDIQAPALSVSVTNGTTYAKSHTATITISDNKALAAGTYTIKYAWGTSAVACSSMSNSTSITVAANSTSKTASVTISSGTGAGKIYVCNSAAIKDAAGNSLAANTVVNASMYQDNTAPVASFNADETNKIQCTDSIGVTSYYFGTASPTSSSSYTSITSTTSMSIVKNITSATKYYLACKDSSGNVSSTASYTYKQVVVTFYKNTSSSDTTTVQQTFIEGRSGNRFGYNNDGTPRWEQTGQFGKWDRSGYNLLGWSATRSATEKSWDVYSGVTNAWIRGRSPSLNIYAVWKAKPKINCARIACRDGGTVNSGGFPSVYCCFATTNCYYDSCGDASKYGSGNTTTWKVKKKGASNNSCTSYCIIKNQTSCPSGYKPYADLGLEGC